MTGRETCGGSASGVLKRSDFGMIMMPKVVGDDLKLWIAFEGLKN